MPTPCSDCKYRSSRSDYCGLGVRPHLEQCNSYRKGDPLSPPIPILSEIAALLQVQPQPLDATMPYPLRGTYRQRYPTPNLNRYEILLLPGCPLHGALHHTKDYWRSFSMGENYLCVSTQASYVLIRYTHKNNTSTHLPHHILWWLNPTIDIELRVAFLEKLRCICTLLNNQGRDYIRRPAIFYGALLAHMQVHITSALALHRLGTYYIETVASIVGHYFMDPSIPLSLVTDEFWNIYAFASDFLDRVRYLEGIRD
jgi:hypothetical protein